MKKALIIGSTSLVGQALVAELSLCGMVYETLDRSSSFTLFEEYGAEYWDEVIVGYNEVVYISWIGRPSTAQDAIVEGVDVNLRALSCLCAAFGRRGAGHLVFMSSAGALYSCGQAVATELCEVAPTAYYGESKLRAEQIIEKSFTGQLALRASILRVSNIVGLREQLTSGFDLVNHLVTCLREGREFLLYGDGENTRDFVVVSDVVAAIRLVLNRDVGSQIFNICAGQSHSVNEMISMVESLSGKELKLCKLQKRGVDVRHIRVSACKAKDLLEWNAKTSLKEYITQLLHVG